MFFEAKTSMDRFYQVLQYEHIHSLTHSQRSYELLVVTPGVVHAEKRGVSFRLHAGQAIWIMPYEVHRFETVEVGKVCVIIFSIDTMPDVMELMENSMFTNPVLSIAEEELQAFLSQDQMTFGLKGLLYTYCDRLIQNGLTQCASNAMSDPMTQLTLYIQEHFDENLNLKDIAQHLGYSYHYTSSLFQKMFHMGFAQYMKTLRLEEAARRLRNTDAAIQSICYACGFATMRNFDHAFSRYYGMSPSAYRHSKRSL